MPRHGQNSRRERASFIARWLVGIAATGGLAAWETVRVVEARATATGGWAAGIAAGAGGGLALTALLAVTILIKRQRSRSGGRLQATLIITIVLLLVVAIFTSTPPRQSGPHPVPYVTTSGIEVAEIAYISTCLAQFAVLLAVWIVVALVREHGGDDADCVIAAGDG
jgi:hypothetical protein